MASTSRSSGGPATQSPNTRHRKSCSLSAAYISADGIFVALNSRFISSGRRLKFSPALVPVPIDTISMSSAPVVPAALPAAP